MKILIIFPHPDDETIFCGGTIARHVKAGDEVVWICAGLGERSGRTEKRYSLLSYFIYLILGNFIWLVFIQKLAIWWLSIFRKTDTELAKIRKKEALETAKILGISKVYFLGIEDMRFRKHIPEMTERIKEHIDLCQPEIIYTFHLNGLTGHADHVALSRAVIEATKNYDIKIFGSAFPKKEAKKFKLPLLSVNDNEIGLEANLSEDEIRKKREAIKAYKSQSYIWKIFSEKHPEILEREYFVELK